MTCDRSWDRVIDECIGRLVNVLSAHPEIKVPSDKGFAVRRATSTDGLRYVVVLLGSWAECLNLKQSMPTVQDKPTIILHADVLFTPDDIDQVVQTLLIQLGSNAVVQQKGWDEIVD